ncbi:calcineurin-like phosphoesterase family protein [Sphingomonas sp. S17]|jgi:3',5'-cyclic AMP phosphodiesterase CpdA|uniref:Metallophosphoesterase n=2 Tax=Sphingomonas paucimobilis TaxID=13689 RepID=A0A411LJ65_SPHPI|nr:MULTISPECIES: metallophosphoesterase [Sphingomonas]EGI56441.1 calcineurin-like phosphoesterase family protein [Sphingomonas sp. S17]MBQ1478959.1 metallophosphoesterase [Sphingomonas sp.]MCM3678453.1 metallophosphoesterase [Sphingomonas paucimobilis]MDG5969480.1 metallophosphoesterase [Sphingomonas paucimobilis]NNG56103.1 metallophosphoesterase [Sphingomonas paucimobilis]
MIRLFHVSDVHFGAEDPAALAWFAERVAAEKPDAVIMTGDLTMRATKREFQAGGEWLQSLGVPVTVEVGNHDIPYYWDPFRRFFAPYQRYAAVERMIEKPLDLPGVTVVPLKTTARAQWRWNWSKGRVSSGSLRRALALIAQAPKDHLILVAAHHPLIEGGTKGTAKTRNGDEALSQLAAAGAHAVLSGHVHDPFDVPIDRNGWIIRMIGAGTLSKRTRKTPPAFNEIRIEGQGFETLVRRFGETAPHVITEDMRAG